MTTIADVQLDPKSYIEIYNATSITPGTQILVQNKSRGLVYVQNKDEQPPSTSSDGFIIAELDLWVVPTGTMKAWFRGDGAIAVEIS